MGWGSQSLGYRPQLDGIRAMAILAVMLFHSILLVPEPLRPYGGFMGVDLFFVLSGFLITTLLVQEFDRTGTVDFARFFRRRALRLLPALLLSLLVAGAIVVYVGQDVGRFLGNALTAVTYTANWFAGAGHGFGVLTPLWSLAVEGQFYLAWPPLLALALRRGVPRGRIVLLLLASALVVVLLRRLFFPVDPAMALFWTFTRADGLLIGSALALAMPNPHLRAVLRSPPLAWTAALAVGVALWKVGPGEAAVYNGLLLGFNLCAAVVVGHVLVRDSSLLARGLRLRPLVLVGLISYGLYVFHAPLNRLTLEWAQGWNAGSVLIARVLAAVVIAAASYILVERQALRLKDKVTSTTPQGSGPPRDLVPLGGRD